MGIIVFRLVPSTDLVTSGNIAMATASLHHQNVTTLSERGNVNVWEGGQQMPEGTRQGATLAAETYLETRLERIGVSRPVARLYESRRVYSETRLEELARRLRSAPHLQQFPNLTIYAAGSYARGEASPHSDIDLFFLHDDVDTVTVDDPRLRGIRAVAAVIREIEEGMEFPPPSNDGQFLNIIKLSEMLSHLGGAEDDYKNHFTARLLLYLESRPVFGSEAHRTSIEKIVNSYMRDYEDHAADFRPTFLVNDILRFWRTLCLNYEHRRNQMEAGQKTKQKIKNFKLGFSRLSTCFATVSLLSSYNSVEPQELVAISVMTPLERFLNLSDRVPEVAPFVRAVIEQYAWFMEKTSLSADQLIEYFGHKENRTEAFSNADKFGQAVFDLLRATAEARKTLRYLVV